VSSSASPLLTEPTRRALNDRQARTVPRLTDAALDELRDVGYDGLTVRTVSKRAGVAPATAYTYFAGKDHVVTEVFWRRLKALATPRIDKRLTASSRVTEALAGISQLAAEESELVAACTQAMLSPDPEVKRLRDLVAHELHQRFIAALGPQADSAVLRALDLALTGALTRAGMGHLDYQEIPSCMYEVARLLLDGRK
jgi:AcrR family transcriptional regulator